MPGATGVMPESAVKGTSPNVGVTDASFRSVPSASRKMSTLPVLGELWTTRSFASVMTGRVSLASGTAWIAGVPAARKPVTIAVASAAGTTLRSNASATVAGSPVGVTLRV